MPSSGDNPNKQTPRGNLEDWLQLPDSGEPPPGSLDELPESSDEIIIEPDEPMESGEPETSDPEIREEDNPPDESPDETEQDSEPKPLSLFPDLPSEETGQVEKEPVKDSADAGDGPEEPGLTITGVADTIQHIEKLEKFLIEEFSDTLTGTNALTLPVGISLIILSVLGWFLKPVTELLTTFEFSWEFYSILLLASVVMALGGIHLVFYWLIHRISNGVKSRELDRLIELRREKNTCRYLDCIETGGDAEEIVGTDTDAADEETEAETEAESLAWECSLFHVDLEDLPICAVCDRYEPVPPPDFGTLPRDVN